MSIVGPYPLRAEDARYVGGIARFRYDMRPGVTGRWRTGSGTVARDVLLVQDAVYVQNWSLLNDAKIFVATLWHIVLGRRRVVQLVESGADDTQADRGDLHAH
jgi:lipopolysaccharide/colanic/teichoic acid biosynthesis glycosyltransferase